DVVRADVSVLAQRDGRIARRDRLRDALLVLAFRVASVAIRHVSIVAGFAGIDRAIAAQRARRQRRIDDEAGGRSDASLHHRRLGSGSVPQGVGAARRGLHRAPDRSCIMSWVTIVLLLPLPVLSRRPPDASVTRHASTPRSPPLTPDRTRVPATLA